MGTADVQCGLIRWLTRAGLAFEISECGWALNFIIACTLVSPFIHFTVYVPDIQNPAVLIIEWILVWAGDVPWAGDVTGDVPDIMDSSVNWWCTVWTGDLPGAGDVTGDVPDIQNPAV